jgi:hypothetical protein
VERYEADRRNRRDERLPPERSGNNHLVAYLLEFKTGCFVAAAGQSSSKALALQVPSPDTMLSVCGA